MTDTARKPKARVGSPPANSLDTAPNSAPNSDVIQQESVSGPAGTYDELIPGVKGGMGKVHAPIGPGKENTVPAGSVPRGATTSAEAASHRTSPGRNPDRDPEVSDNTYGEQPKARR
jgi:hypothetical protein